MKRTLGRIEILTELSRGGMGEVLLGRNVGPHGFEKLVAIKTIRKELFGRDDVRKMFLDEARIMAKLDHPSIVQVHDFGETGGLLYLAMEYVAGVPLGRLIESGPVPFAVAARIIAEACRGLHAAHELKSIDGRPLRLVHRDVSPQNLLLTFEGRIKILDFGVALARNREAPVTEIGRLKGKAAYVAPEQLDGSRIDRRTDLYGAGVVLHELLTGRRLFADDPLSRAHLPTAPSESVRSVPPELDVAVLRALALAPSDRFADAREMAIALEEAVKDAPATLLAEYAERHLREARDAHDARIRTLISGSERPATTPARGGETIVQGSLASVRPVEEGPARPIVKRRALRLALVLGSGLLTGGGVALWLLRATSERTAIPSPAQVKAQIPAVHPPPPPPIETAEPPSDPPPKKIVPRRKHVASNLAPLAPKEFGFITVGADPFGIVIIDGIDLGVSPLADHRLEEGEHEISLLHPTTRALIRSKKISVRPGERMIVKL